MRKGDKLVKAAPLRSSVTNQRLYHVGPIRSKCLEEHRCGAPAEVKRLKAMSFTDMSLYEKQKPASERYPSNDDSIGIELVGAARALSDLIGSARIMLSSLFFRVFDDQTDPVWSKNALGRNTNGRQTVTDK